MSESKLFLEKNLYQEGLNYFGIKDRTIAENLANRWHNDKNSVDTLRWNEAEKFNDHKGKILDMACGVGTYLFAGLHKGYNIYGIEPEEYKLKYMSMKINEMNYPKEWENRIIKGIGENLPFENTTFDYITSYQTLEHVQNVEKCLDEMIRVLKVEGKIKINCPDYNSFYEPHYQLPFLPRMNKKLAFIYLTLLKRPTIGLNFLNWTTNKSMIKFLEKYRNIEIINLNELYKNRKISSIQAKYKLPRFFSIIIVNYLFYRKIYIAQEEKSINLIIKKLSN